MIDTIVIFGSSDHESILAKEIARNSNCHVAQATCEGKPVHAGNAYKADGFEIEDGIEFKDEYNFVITFECNNELAMQFESIQDIHCDHHNPGDYGYDKGPAQFWAASSIGQLCKVLDVWSDDELLYTAAADHFEQFINEYKEKGYSVYGNPTRGFAGAEK